MSYGFSFVPVLENWRAFLEGTVLTLELSAGATVLGLGVAVPSALAKVHGPSPIRWSVDAYVEVVRNTPFLVQIFFVFFALPKLGLRLTSNVAALAALTINVGAYATEIIRAGIEAVPRGQGEAATALGLSRLQTFRYVVLKPAMRTVYPALTSQFVFLMLTSSVVSAISATDLAAAGYVVQSQTFAAFEVYLVVTAIYLALSVGITPRATDFAQWYLDAIAAAPLSSYSDTPGCTIVEPDGTAIWDRIRFILDAEIAATGHRNVLYPTLIRESYIQREAAHIGGFAPELVKVERLHGDTLDDALVLRPTSETVVYQDWAKKIRSRADLPIKINQWGNVFRAERRTRPFLRTFEFHWQEGHTAHATREEAMEETLGMLEVYRRFLEETLAIPAIAGRKPESERFAGAEETFTIEAMMGDGKALQSATSHYIGASFPSAFGVRFQAGANEFRPVHATSWGMSTRIIGALVMVHGDDRGVVMPPRVAPVQLAVLAIRDARTLGCTGYATLCKSIVDRLHAEGVRAELDYGEDRLGTKHFRYEKRGVPLRAVIGAAELDRRSVTITIRDTGERVEVPLDDFAPRVAALLEAMQERLLAVARDRLSEGIVRVRGPEDVESALARGNVFVAGGWCGDAGSEERLRKEYGLTIRCLPLRPLTAEARCFITGAPAKHQVVAAKAY